MKLDAFNNRQKQDTKALLEILLANGVATLAEALAVLSTSIRTQVQKQDNVCPECKKYPLVTSQVNQCKASNVGGGYKAVKICKHCKYEEWVK